MGGRCVPVTGIAVQSVFDGDYGSQLSRWLTSKLGDAGFKAYRSTDYPDVNVASINITGLIDHWATPQDLTAPRVGVSDIQIVDRRSNALLSRFQTGQGSAFTAPTLPEYVDSLVEEIQRRYCQV